MARRTAERSSEWFRRRVPRCRLVVQQNRGSSCGRARW